MWSLYGKSERKECINGPGHITKMAATPILGKTAASVSAVFKELAQHPPHTLFDMWNLFFDHPKCFLGTLSPRVVVHNFSTACYTRYLPKI